MFNLRQTDRQTDRETGIRPWLYHVFNLSQTDRHTDTRPWLYNVFNLRQTDTHQTVAILGVQPQTDRHTPDRGCTVCSTSDKH